MRRRDDPAQRVPIPEWVLGDTGPAVHVPGAPERVMTTQPGQDGWDSPLKWADAHGYDVFELAEARMAWRAGRRGAVS
jgi:hypothetical protein